MLQWNHVCELQYQHHAWPIRLWMAGFTRSQTCHPCLGTLIAHWRCSHWSACMVNGHGQVWSIMDGFKLFELNLSISVVTLTTFHLTENRSSPELHFHAWCCVVIVTSFDGDSTQMTYDEGCQSLRDCQPLHWSNVQECPKLPMNHPSTKQKFGAHSKDKLLPSGAEKCMIQEVQNNLETCEM